MKSAKSWLPGLAVLVAVLLTLLPPRPSRGGVGSVPAMLRRAIACVADEGLSACAFLFRHRQRQHLTVVVKARFVLLHGQPMAPVTDGSGRLAGKYVWRTVAKALGIPDSEAGQFPDVADAAPLSWLLA